MKKIIIVIPIVLLGLLGLYLFKDGGNEPLRFNPIDSPDTASDTGQKKTSESPADVVEQYMRYTLGTLPDAALDYSFAKQLLTADLALQWTDDSFVPLSYGIQQGPDKVEINDESVGGNTATVKVSAYWGNEMGRKWTFTLTSLGTSWQISDLSIE